MNMDEEFDNYLRSPNPLNELRSLVARLADQGLLSAQILDVFDSQRNRLRSANREAEEDLVTDAMDFIVGWCSPHTKLFNPASKAVSK